MDHSDTTIYLTRAFEGPRHERCYAAWDTIASHENTGGAKVVIVSNEAAELSHAEMFEYLWDEARADDSRYTILTEADFLPDLTKDWIGTAKQHLLDTPHSPRKALVGCEYMTRDPHTWELQDHKYWECQPFSAGWFLFIDKEQFSGDLDFHVGDDPATHCVEQIGRERSFLHPGEEVFFSQRYPWGTHLFWSRHYNDIPFRGDPDPLTGKVRLEFVMAGGFPIFAVQTCTDKLMTRWEKSGRI